MSTNKVILFVLPLLLFLSIIVRIVSNPNVVNPIPSQIYESNTNYSYIVSYNTFESDSRSSLNLRLLPQDWLKGTTHFDSLGGIFCDNDFQDLYPSINESLVYVANGRFGLLIIDTTDFSQPSELGRLAAQPLDTTVYQECYGVVADEGSKVAVLSCWTWALNPSGESEEVLYLIDVKDAKNPVLLDGPKKIVDRDSSHSPESSNSHNILMSIGEYTQGDQYVNLFIYYIDGGSDYCFSYLEHWTIEDNELKFEFRSRVFDNFPSGSVQQGTYSFLIGWLDSLIYIVDSQMGFQLFGIGDAEIHSLGAFKYGEDSAGPSLYFTKHLPKVGDSAVFVADSSYLYVLDASVITEIVLVKRVKLWNGSNCVTQVIENSGYLYVDVALGEACDWQNNMKESGKTLFLFELQDLLNSTSPSSIANVSHCSSRNSYFAFDSTNVETFFACDKSLGMESLSFKSGEPQEHANGRSACRLITDYMTVQGNILCTYSLGLEALIISVNEIDNSNYEEINWLGNIEINDLYYFDTKSGPQLLLIDSINKQLYVILIGYTTITNVVIISVYDISDIKNPRVVRTRNFDAEEVGGIQFQGWFTDEKTNISYPLVWIWGAGDGIQPNQLALLDPDDLHVHDISIFNASTCMDISGVLVEKGFVYITTEVFCSSGSSFRILDIRDIMTTKSPVLVYQTNSSIFGNPGLMKVYGDFLYLYQSVCSPYPCSGGIYIFNIQTKEDPVFVSKIPVDEDYSTMVDLAVDYDSKILITMSNIPDYSPIIPFQYYDISDKSHPNMWIDKITVPSGWSKLGWFTGNKMVVKGSIFYYVAGGGRIGVLGPSRLKLQGTPQQCNKIRNVTIEGRDDSGVSTDSFLVLFHGPECVMSEKKKVQWKVYVGVVASLFFLCCCCCFVVCVVLWVVNCLAILISCVAGVVILVVCLGSSGGCCSACLYVKQNMETYRKLYEKIEGNIQTKDPNVDVKAPALFF